MGNSITIGTKTTKVMLMDGQIFKIQTPAKARHATINYPNHVLLESEAVKKYGARATPLAPNQDLKPKKSYYMVELSRLRSLQAEDRRPPLRGVGSGVHMSAQERLDSSDIGYTGRVEGSEVTRPVRVKMRLPTSQVMKFLDESKNSIEMTQKIIDLYMDTGNDISHRIHFRPAPMKTRPKKAKHVSFAL